VAVLCPSIAQEQLRGHRDFRVLASRLAARGVSTLRFDYPATGNSTGEMIRGAFGECDRAEQWCASIVDAVAHARDLVADADVVLVGRRMGALLSARASRMIPGGIQTCVLWEPVVSGATYLRELRLREATRLVEWEEELNRVYAGIALQSEGHQFDAATVDGMSRLTLETLPPHARTVHLVGTDLQRAERAVAKWSDAERPGELSMHVAADAAFDWAVPEGQQLPETTLGLVESAIMASTIERATPTTIAPLRADARVAHRGSGGSELTDAFVRFGPQERLFGVHTSSTAEVRVALLMLGTGVEPSPGLGDMWTSFARRAAPQGIAVLRMDYSGIGESLPATPDSENVSYHDCRLDDLRAGVAWLRARWPGAKLVVGGMCTGGYYGVHAGANGIAIDRVISINPQLYWTPGAPTDLRPAQEAFLAQRSAAAAADPSKWMRLLRGGYRWQDVKSAAKGMIMRRLASAIVPAKTGGALSSGMPRLDFATQFPPTARVDLVFCTEDFGYGHLLAHGARQFRELVEQPHMALHLIPGDDHTFSRASMRAQLERVMLDVIAQV